MPIKAVLKKIDGFVFGDLNNQYAKLLAEEARNCDSLLDVGCGSNSPIKFFSNKIPRVIGLDLYKPSIEKSKEQGIHNEYVVANVMDIEQHFGENSIDIVIASDLIEHLTKEDGLELMRQMESVARKKVVIFTPNGFLPQGEYDGNIYQKHLSGWEVAEMREKGYRVLGVNGLKSLRGEYAIPTIKPHWLGHRISLLTQNFVLFNPEKAFAIMCIKNMH